MVLGVILVVPAKLPDTGKLLHKKDILPVDHDKLDKDSELGKHLEEGSKELEKIVEKPVKPGKRLQIKPI
jgi:hypothetical protein